MSVQVQQLIQSPIQARLEIGTACPPTARIGNKPYLCNKGTLEQSKANRLKFTSTKTPNLMFYLFEAALNFVEAIEVCQIADMILEGIQRVRCNHLRAQLDFQVFFCIRIRRFQFPGQEVECSYCKVFLRDPQKLRM